MLLGPEELEGVLERGVAGVFHDKVLEHNPRKYADHIRLLTDVAMDISVQSNRRHDFVCKMGCRRFDKIGSLAYFGLQRL